LNDWHHSQVSHAPRWTDEYPNKPCAWLGASMKAFFEGNLEVMAVISKKTLTSLLQEKQIPASKALHLTVFF
jgi:hypothetical protein